MDEARAYLDGAQIDGPAASLPAHRPNTYTEEIVDKICDCIGRGIPMVEIFKQPDFPSLRTYYRWKQERPEFAQIVNAAIQFRTEARADEIIKIVDDNSGQYDILRIEQRVKWRWKIMGADMPKKYGDSPVPEALPAPSEARPGDNAKVIDGKVVEIEPDPMQQAMDEWRRMRTDAATETPRREVSKTE